MIENASVEQNEAVMMEGPCLEVRQLSKRFPGTVALDRVSFEVGSGTFHALLGGNGSGKSTLIKILAGVLQGAPGGSLSVAGTEVSTANASPAWARRAGVRFVHQDLGLFESMTVAENIALHAGFAGRRGVVHWAAARERTAKLLESLRLDISPDTLVGSLSPAQRTHIAIARALDSAAGEIKLLVLDEPTARLPNEEVDELLALLRRLTAAGTTVLYVTHRLGEVLQAADAVTVLRDGKTVATRAASGLDEKALVELIVGRPIDSIFPAEIAHDGPRERALEVTGLCGGPVNDLNLELSAGEILGIGGAIGAGRSTLLRLLFGASRRRTGVVKVAGQAEEISSPAKGMRAGIAYVPEDRAHDAAFMTLGVTENLSAATLKNVARFGCLRRVREKAAARRDVASLQIRTASVDTPLQSLSGGNQQKAILARWLRLDTKVLLLDEPTQGVDVGARADIYELIRAAAAEGVGVIVASSDFDELVGISNRVLVMADGRVVAEGRPPAVDADWIAHHTHTATTAVSAS